MLAVAAVVLAAMYAKRLTLAQQLVRAQIERPAAFDFAFVISGAPMVSPDGQQIAFVALKNNKTAIFCSTVKYGEGRATGRHGRRHIPLLVPRREGSALFFQWQAEKDRGWGWKITCANKNLPRRSCSIGGYAAPLKFGSTVMPHSLSSCEVSQ